MPTFFRSWHHDTWFWLKSVRLGQYVSKAACDNHNWKTKSEQQKNHYQGPMPWPSTFNPAMLVECSQWRDLRRPKSSFYVSLFKDTQWPHFGETTSEAVIEPGFTRGRDTQGCYRAVTQCMGAVLLASSWLFANSVFLGNSPSFLIFKGGIIIISSLHIFCESWKSLHMLKS